jgi:hypothetical protein
MLKGPGVTVPCSCEFLDADDESELIETTGEISCVGRSLALRRTAFAAILRPCYYRAQIVKG